MFVRYMMFSRTLVQNRCKKMVLTKDAFGKFASFLRDGVPLTLLRTKFSARSNAIQTNESGKKSIEHFKLELTKHATAQFQHAKEWAYVHFVIFCEILFEYINKVKLSLFENVIFEWHSCISVRFQWWWKKKLVIKMAAIPLCTHIVCDAYT